MSLPSPSPISDALTDNDKEECRQKILHVLKIYPGISPSMLQCGLGPATQPRLWRPILHQLIVAGIVVQEEVSTLTRHKGQFRTYKKLTLTSPPPLTSSD